MMGLALGMWKLVREETYQATRTNALPSRKCTCAACVLYFILIDGITRRDGRMNDEQTSSISGGS